MSAESIVQRSQNSHELNMKHLFYYKQYQQKIRMQAQQTINDSSSPNINAYSLTGWIYASLAVLIAYSYYKLQQARKRKRKFHQGIKQIEKGKIIIAIQIKDFFVRYSQKYVKGYLPLNIQIIVSPFESLKRKLFGMGHFYKSIFPPPKIKQFMNGLASVSKISLMMYTSLEPEVAQVILNKLGIDKCFPQDMRKYCDLQNHDDQKHAIEVDRDSRRVIILSPTYDDHQNEDDKYFLVVKPKPEQTNFLKDWQRQLKDFIEKNKNINNLHEELTQFKINVQSQSQGYEL